MHPNCEVFQFFLTTENHQFGMRNPRRYFGCGATRIPMHLVIWDPRTAPGFGKKMTISWNRFFGTFPNNNNNNSNNKNKNKNKNNNNNTNSNTNNNNNNSNSNSNNNNNNTLDHPPWLNVRPLRAPRKPDRGHPSYPDGNA